MRVRKLDFRKNYFCNHLASPFFVHTANITGYTVNYKICIYTEKRVQNPDIHFCFFIRSFFLLLDEVAFSAIFAIYTTCSGHTYIGMAGDGRSLPTCRIRKMMQNSRYGKD